MKFILVHATTHPRQGGAGLAGALGTHGHDVTTIDLPVSRPD
ncbi:MAG: hypothetical protein ACRD3Q_19895 [Terriglobales bacterium]